MVRDGQSPLALCCRLDPLAESCNQCFFFLLLSEGLDLVFQFSVVRFICRHHFS